MLDLGHAHPDFVYPNDLVQAKVAIIGSLFAAIFGSILIVVSLLRW